MTVAEALANPLKLLCSALGLSERCFTGHHRLTGGGTMQVHEIMSKMVVTIPPHETVSHAARKMRDERVGCVVVVSAGAIKGILTDRDLTVRCISEGHDPTCTSAKDYMTTPVLTIQSSNDIVDAARLMNGHQIKRLPVVDEGRLVGMVSFSDVAQAMVQPMSDLLAAMGMTSWVASPARAR